MALNLYLKKNLYMRENSACRGKNPIFYMYSEGMLVSLFLSVFIL